MIDTHSILLRLAGGMMLLLSASHLLIGRRLRWREEAARLSPVNTSIFHVHTFFICLVLVMQGLPSLLEPSVFLTKSRAGLWLAWGCAFFWAVRLCIQWFVFPSQLWRGKKFETIVHVCFSILWVFFTALFTVCGMWQSGWVH